MITAAAIIASACLATPAHAAKFAVLDFWGAGGFVHDSRVSANTYLDSLAKALDFELVKTQDPAVFTTAGLAKYQVLVLNHVSRLGNVANTSQRAALMQFFRTKGTVAWHGTGDIKDTWPEFVAFLGGQFMAHGANTQVATLRRDPAAAPHALASLGPPSAVLDEEWYSYSANPRLTAGVTVLYTLDESTCKGCGPAMGDHPIIWTRTGPEGGRFFHSGIGHTHDVFQKTAMTKAFYAQAILWAAGASEPSTVLLGAKASADGAGGSAHFRNGVELRILPGVGATQAKDLRPADGIPQWTRAVRWLSVDGRMGFAPH